jgi:hypothetical protein
VTVDAHDAIEWSARLAEDGAGTMNLRNGASRVRRARNAVMRLVDEGVAPASSEVEAMGWMFALAEQAARRYGVRALSMVRTTAHAISEVLDEVLAHSQRNMPWLLAAAEFMPPEWKSGLAKIAGVAGNVGSASDPLVHRSLQLRHREERIRARRAGAEPRGPDDGRARSAEAPDVRVVRIKAA